MKRGGPSRETFVTVFFGDPQNQTEVRMETEVNKETV